ncbi:MAG: hypothetical protein J3Q66DRAFT_329012 [Benniella sp.]|nr:MAG: hypothetical protein J3Q66DRAFT_329012 [Benniella sp.]
MTDLEHHSRHSMENDGDKDDDIWGDDDAVSYDRAIAEREWSRLHDTFGNTGYREGIEEGKEGTLQQGFNQGWADGVQYGYELGRLRGLISPLIEYLRSTTPSSSSPFKDLQDKEAWIKKASELTKELVELDIAKVFDKAFFDDGYKSTPSKSTPTNTGSGCCGGSNKESCCQKEAAQGESSSPSSSSSTAKECCSSKQAGGGGACLSAECDSTVKKDHPKEEGSSRPEQLIANYRSRVNDLLSEIGLASLLEAA